MPFDLTSFLAGFGGGAVTTGAYYALLRRRRARQLLATEITQAETQTPRSIQEVRRSLRRSTLRRYIDETLPWIEQYHLPGSQFKLSDLVVEAHLLVDINDYEVDLNDDSPPLRNSSYVVPRIHDFPEVYSAYTLETTRLNDFLYGDRHVAILGKAGMGKSTVLATLALMALGITEFEEVQEFAPERLAGINDKELLAMNERFEQIQGMAQAHISEIKRAEIRETHGDKAAQEAEFNFSAPDIHSFLPILVHLASIEIDMSLYGVRVDPSEPLIRSVQERVSPLSGRLLPVMLYQQLEQGNCLILLDGYDDLSESERARIYPWIQSLKDHYGHNRIVITGPAAGYDPLLTLGFTPAFIAPLDETRVHQLIKNWVKTFYTSRGKTITADNADHQLIQKLLDNNRNYSVFDLSLKFWATLAGAPDETRSDWYAAYIQTHAPDTPQTSLILREIAKVLLDRGTPLKNGQLIEIATTRTESAGNPLSDTGGFIRSLRQTGLLVGRADGTYDFRHPGITAYLGGQSLIHDMTHRLPEVAVLPQWTAALSFAAAELDMSPAIHACLNTETDLLYSNLFTVARWLAEGDYKSAWRGEILKRLSGVFLAPSQFDAIRERALAALVASRDPNVSFIFKQGIRHTSPVVRKLSCIGLGALGMGDVLRELRSMLEDKDAEVQLATIHALGAIRSEGALETMVEYLLGGQEPVRQAVAESFVGIPNEGHEVLRDAAGHQDMLVRRAAAYGLARIPALWALEGLFHIMVDDSQWYVRSAAESIFRIVRDPEHRGPHASPTPQDMRWVHQWIGQFDDVPEDVTVEQVLIHAMQNGRPAVRELAARTFAQLGPAQSIRPLYIALIDKEESVRTAAYQALAVLGQRATKPLPGIA